MSKQSKDNCIKYGVDEHNDNAVKLFGSMNDISIMTIILPKTSKKNSEQIVFNKINKNSNADLFTISSIQNNEAVVFVYTKKWIDNIRLRSCANEILPEIYLVPFHGTTSVCLTNTGYIVRDGINSGFRIKNESAVKKYLAGKKYELYKLGDHKTNDKWQVITEKETKKSWLASKRIRKISTSYITKNASSALFPYILISVAVVLWSVLFIQNENYINDIKYKDKTLAGYINKEISPLGLVDDFDMKSIDAELNKRKASNILGDFKATLQEHYDDEFIIDQSQVVIKSKKKYIKRLKKVKVVYE